MCHLVPQLAQLLLGPKGQGVLLAVSPAHTDSLWEHNRERSLEKLDSTLAPGKAGTSPSFMAILALCYY